MVLRSITNSFMHLFYPKVCIGCMASIYEEANDLCIKCAATLPETDFHDDRNNYFYNKLINKVPIYQACSLFYTLKGSTVHKLIYQFKYNNRPDVATSFGLYYGFLLKTADEFELPEILVPVPLHPLKYELRGYNQSECIANGLSEKLNIPVDIDNLIKKEHTNSQTKKSRLKRLKNVDEIFVCENGAFDNKHIAIIDDVMTTGATISSCIDAINASCKNVKISVITFAIVKS